MQERRPERELRGHSKDSKGETRQQPGDKMVRAVREAEAGSWRGQAHQDYIVCSDPDGQLITSLFQNKQYAREQEASFTSRWLA